MYVIIIIGILLLLAVGFLSIDCFAIIQPSEFGKKVRLGKPVGTKLDSGLRLKWPLIEKIIRIPKGLMVISFTADSITTRTGKVRGYENVQSIDVDLDCAIYLAFDENRLDDILQYSPGFDAEELMDYLVGFMLEIARGLGGRAPWRLINQERYDSSQWIRARLVGGKYKEIKEKDGYLDFCEEFYILRPGEPKQTAIDAGVTEENKIKRMAQENPFTKIGFKDVSFVIEDINYSDEITIAISEIEKSALKKQSIIKEAEAEKEKKVLLGEGEAIAREKMLEAIKKSPELEAINALKEIGKGQSNFIFPIPKEFMDLIGNLYKKP